MVMTMAGRFPDFAALFPHWLYSAFNPNDKTFLAPYRFLHFVVIAIMADEVSRRWGWYWLLVLPLFIAWPALLYIAFSRRYRSLEERGGKELPHMNL